MLCKRAEGQPKSLQDLPKKVALADNFLIDYRGPQDASSCLKTLTRCFRDTPKEMPKADPKCSQEQEVALLMQLLVRHRTPQDAQNTLNKYADTIHVCSNLFINGPNIATQRIA